MRIVQKIILKSVPKPVAISMEMETRQWHVVCPKCDHSRSVWELGGLRWKVSSYGQRLLAKCNHCSKWSVSKAEKREDE